MQGLHFPFVLFNKRNSPAASSDTLKDVCIVVLKTQLDSTLSDAAFRADSPGRGRGPGPARPPRQPFRGTWLFTTSTAIHTPSQQVRRSGKLYLFSPDEFELFC